VRRLQGGVKALLAKKRADKAVAASRVFDAEFEERPAR
jgi:hypothetical protein